MGLNNPCAESLLHWVGNLSTQLKTQLHAPLAVAYSGGADSTALLLAVKDLWQAPVFALHINHGMQAAAAGFETHAQSFCAARQISLCLQRVQVSTATGTSPEDMARQARYAALAELALVQGVQHVLLAQHADDQVETLLLALTRGAGLPGLAAMPASFERHGCTFHRPILGVRAEAIRAWLDAQHILYVQDPSNADTQRTRNAIRHHLLPVLEQHFAAFRQTFARSATHAAQGQVLLDDLARLDAAQTGLPPCIKALQTLTPERQANLLRHWLKSQHQTAASAVQLQELLKQIAACTTRGHSIAIKLGSGFVQRAKDHLKFGSVPP